jgi:hypothetical protein
MQLTARSNRAVDNDHPHHHRSLADESNDSSDIGSPSPRFPTQRGATPAHGGTKSGEEWDSKSFRRKIKKKSNTNLLLLCRRLKYQWALLSGGSKVAAALVVLFLCQHIVLGIWDQFFYQIGVVVSNEVSSTVIPSTETYFAVAINTYKRPDMLREAVQHYADTCGRWSGVSQVFIIWAEQNSEIPHPSSFFDDQKPIRGSLKENNRATVHVLQKAKDSLNSRFEPIPQLESTAVFMVDDDLRAACPSLRNAFQAWKTRPDAMAGYYPRLASPPRGQSSSSSNGELIYHTWPVVYWQQSFNLVLTKACFLHSKYLELYTNDNLFPRAIKDHVDQHMNCEDIAMSMLVANYTKYQTGSPAHPIYVEGSVSDKGLIGGISSGSGHMTTRSECLTQLTAILRQEGWGSPFDYQVALRPNAWIRHAPGLWWQYRPSNVFEWLALANTFT